MSSEGIFIDKALLRSEAFRSLRNRSMLIYLDFLNKRRMSKIKGKEGRKVRWSVSNNGDITYPYSEAEHKGISRQQFSRDVTELIDKGFVDINHQGSGGKKGDQTTYIISDRWKKYETPDFQPPLKQRIKDSRQGRGWAAYHAKKKKSVSKTILKKTVSNMKNYNRKEENKIVSIMENDTQGQPKNDLIKSNA